MELFNVGLVRNGRRCRATAGGRGEFEFFVRRMEVGEQNGGQSKRARVYMTRLCRGH
jgi:hypothetical protein